MKYNEPYGGAANDPYVNGDPSIGRAGSIPPAGAIEFPQREIVNLLLAAGLATPDNADLQQLLRAVRSEVLQYTLDTGTANAVVLTPNPSWPAYVDGHVIRFKKMNADNTTTTPTMAVSGLSALNLKDSAGGSLRVGDLKANGIYDVVRIGTEGRIISSIAGGLGSIINNVVSAVFNVQKVILTTVGANNWSVPATVAGGRVRYRMWGAGGGGGGCQANGYGAAGGNAGDYVEGSIAVTPGGTLAYSIGGGGPGGSGQNSGTQGGNTTIGTGGTLVTARGGSGGAYGNTSGPGLVGSDNTASTGPFEKFQTGAKGMQGIGPANTASAVGGFGGTATMGGGGGPGATGQGYNASAPGGGGGGAGGQSAINTAGGAGGDGRIEIDYVVNT